ncbi:MAG: Cof-type HAD-IIB family hydrolase [Bacteroidales bacterium]|nr:Cof-type HAD-IIB family hydrolase [Bacteroidales bacterium]
MIKAVFFDIDGTLLSYKTHKVLPGTMKALEELRQKGVRLFISSGRPIVLIPPMPLTFDGYITVNGGYCIAGDNVIVSCPIKPDDCSNWLDYASANDITTMCFTEKEMYINRIDDVARALQAQLGFEMPPVKPIQELFGKQVYQFIAIQPAEKDSETLKYLQSCRMPRWHPVFSDIIPNTISKAVGIKAMLDHFGISAEETMAFGDGANDIEMLQLAKIGIAMGNASQVVKDHADYVTDDADNEGIYNALKHFGIIN